MGDGVGHDNGVTNDCVAGDVVNDGVKYPGADGGVGERAPGFGNDHVADNDGDGIVDDSGSDLGDDHDYAGDVE